LADVASEMFYPVLPRFLTETLGAGKAAVGLIEGFADATSSFLKIVSGYWSDKVARKKPLVMLGYGLSAIAKPPIAFATGWPMVLGLRFLDRVGKGVRTSPRDALIASVTDPSIRGRAYGLHRAMDHAGAVLGPLIGAGIIALWALPDKSLFLIAGVPAFSVLFVLIFFVKEEKRFVEPEKKPLRVREVWGELGSPFKGFLLAVVLFALGNSTDAFLLLRLNDLGVAPAAVALLWSAHHVVKMAFSLIGGRLTDRMGSRAPILMGWSVYAGVYLGFGFSTSANVVVALFLAYGVYHGLAEPAEKATVSHLVPERIRGSAFGLFHGAVGLSVLPASLILGLLWQAFGPGAAFGFGAAMAGAAAVALSFVGRAGPAQP
jgi:MFS family permease